MKRRLEELKEQLRERLQPALAPALAWYRGREPREQKVLLLLGITVVALLVYALLWQPAWDARARQIAQWEGNTRLVTWLRANESQIQARRAQAGAQGEAIRGDWVSHLSRAAGELNLSLKSVNAEGSDRVRVQLENQPFAASLAWLGGLAARGINVDSVEFVPGSGSGLVNVRATLAREGG